MLLEMQISNPFLKFGILCKQCLKPLLSFSLSFLLLLTHVSSVFQCFNLHSFSDRFSKVSSYI